MNVSDGHQLNGPSPLTLREYEQRLEDAKYFYAKQIELLKEFLEAELAHAVQVQGAKDDARRVALEGQAKEYSRRLDELNNAHERAEKAVERTERTTVSSALHESYAKEVGTRMNSFATLEQFSTVAGKVDILIRQSDRTAGALNLVRYMGVAGVIALLLGLLRLAGLTH